MWSIFSIELLKRAALIFAPLFKWAVIINSNILYIFMPTVSSCTWRPAGKVLVCGSEDGHEAAGAIGAARGSGLPPVNDGYSEGLRSEEWQWGCRTSWIELVLISRTTQWKGLRPKVSLHLRPTVLELAQQKRKKNRNHWIEFFLLFCFCVWEYVSLLSTCRVCFYYVNLRLIVFRHICFKVTSGRRKKTFHR